MVSFAFNTLIGQVTPIAMEDVGWRYYILFVSQPLQIPTSQPDPY